MLKSLKYLVLVGALTAILCGCNGGNTDTGSDGNYSAGNDKNNVVSDVVSGTESTVSKVVSGTESMMGGNSSKQQTKKRRVKPVVLILFLCFFNKC